MTSLNSTHTTCSCNHLTSFAILVMYVEEDSVCRMHVFFIIKLWRHLRKCALWRNKHCHSRSAVSIRLWKYLIMVKTTHGAIEMFAVDVMSDKYNKPWSDAEHYTQRLIRAYDFRPPIRHLFTDDVTYGYVVIKSGGDTCINLTCFILQKVMWDEDVHPVVFCHCPF